MPFIALDATTAAAAPVTTLGTPLTGVGETLLSLRTELKLQVIRDGVDDPRWNKWINEAYRHVASMVTLKELWGSLPLNTAASQPLYTLPRAVAWIKRIPLSDPALFPYVGGRDMRQIDLDIYRSRPVLQPGQYAYGPYEYFRFNRLLVLWPTPTAVQAITIDFRIRPLDLTVDTDSPILPEEWHEAILLRSRYVAFRSLQIFDKANFAQNDFVSNIRELENTDAGDDASLRASISPISYKSRRRGDSDCDDYR